MTGHALLSASSAHRWLNCTRAPRIEEKLPDSGSLYAVEGSLAHAIAERMLKGQPFNGLITDECFYPGMLPDLEAYTDYCREKLAGIKTKDPAAIMLVERKVDFSSYAPGGFGTADCIIIGDGALEIIDLKFGKGVEVRAEKNPQIMLYALGAINELSFIYDIKQVTMTIAQVRLGNISSYTLAPEELINWGESIKPIADQAYAGEGNFNAGDWCSFCRYRGYCKARAGYMTELYKPYAWGTSCTPEETAKILAITDNVTAWLADVQEATLNEALKGTKIPGFKVVEGRSNRKITDEEGLKKVLINAGFKSEDIMKKPALETITTLEKLAGRKIFSELSAGYIEKPPGKPTLVPVSDKRPEYNSVDREFEFN